VEDVPAHGRELEPDDLQGPFQPLPFYDSMTKKVNPKRGHKITFR